VAEIMQKSTDKMLHPNTTDSLATDSEKHNNNKTHLTSLSKADQITLCEKWTYNISQHTIRPLAKCNP